MKFLLIKNIRIFIIPKKGISKFPFTHALLSKRSRFRNQRSIPESTNRKSLTKPSRSSFPPSPLNVFCAQRKQGSTNERTLDGSSRDPRDSIEERKKRWRAEEGVVRFDCANLPSTSFRRSGPPSRARPRNTRRNAPCRSIDHSPIHPLEPETGSNPAASSNYAVNAIKTEKVESLSTTGFRPMDPPLVDCQV